MFAAIDIASERHVLARLDDAGAAIGNPITITADRTGYDALLAEYPTAHAFARATPRRVAKLRDDGRHVVGPELAPSLLEAATRAVGPHHGPADKLQACHICQDLDTWRQRLAEIEHDIEDLLDTHVPGKLITSLGPQTAARISAASGDPAHCKSASAFAADVGGVPGLRQSGKPTSTRAGIGPLGNARLRRALGRPVLSAVTRNAGLRAASLRLRAAGTPANVAMIAALRKLLHAAYSVAKHRRPFVTTTQGRAGEPPNNAAPRPCAM